MDTNKLIGALVRLGLDLKSNEGAFLRRLMDALPQITAANGWFTKTEVSHALASWSESLHAPSVESWLEKYKIHARQVRRVVIIMAGNIPLVGLHDVLCVLASGNHAIIKTSSNDPLLTRIVLEHLISIAPEFKERITFVEGKIPSCDAIIATGNNSSARYFEYYFRHIPRLIRKNRNSVAILTGKEDAEQLKDLGIDIFRYFGLGCRSISSVLVPESYNFSGFFEQLVAYGDIIHHQKYANNYDYQRACFLLNNIPFLDNHFLLLTKSSQPGSAVAVLHYHEYKNTTDVDAYLTINKDQLQCIVSAESTLFSSVLPGQAQHPRLDDYADNEDTLSFLLSI
jgi:hypothetical protein